jgi:hypothetical protein
MRVFRKRKKYNNLDGASNEEPIPDVVYQMGAEAAARYVAQDLHHARRGSTAEDFYDLPPLYPYLPVEGDMYNNDMQMNRRRERTRTSSPLNFIRSAIGLSRSGSHKRDMNDLSNPYARSNSSQRFGSPVPGSPTQYRSRAMSPVVIASRSASPYHFVQQERAATPHRSRSRSRTASPDVIRRLQRAQLSQDLQRIEQEREHQDRLMRAHPVRFLPQYGPASQPHYSIMNSNSNIPVWHVLQQQQHVYPYF